MMSSELVRKKLDELIRQSESFDYASVSALVGKNRAYIQQFIRRGIPKRLQEDDRRKIAEHFGIPDWELGGPPADFATTSMREFSESSSEGVVLIPSYDVKASAGAGSVVDYDCFDKFLPFRASWLREVSSTGPTNLTVIRVQGDSMYPTLDDGDEILVDISQTEPRCDGVYVLRNADVLHVKRLSLTPTRGQITVKSDNPLYESWDECELDQIEIVGRVVWVGRKL